MCIIMCNEGIIIAWLLNQMLDFFYQSVHPTILKTHIEKRKQRLEEGTDLDWATAEALAMGSLLYQGMFFLLTWK